MTDLWIRSRDPGEVLRLHTRFNPGLYELCDQYSHLRPADLGRSGVRCWVDRSNGRTVGYAIAQRRNARVVILELWRESTASSDPWRSDPPSPEELGAQQSVLKRILGSTGNRSGRLWLRAASDNPFALHLARERRWPLTATFLLSIRRSTDPILSAPAGGTEVRAYRPGDETEYAGLDRLCFHRDHRLRPEVYRRWAQKRSAEAFTAVVERRVVGMHIAEVRRGGALGDFTLAVHPGHRRRGIATELLRAGFRSLRRRKARWIIADHWGTNGPAVALYRRLGFQVARSYLFFRVR